MMIDRRTFLKTTAVAASAVALGSTGTAFAEGAACSCPGVLYSKDQEGQWAGKSGSHALQVTVTEGTVSVVTNHPMSAEHFIVRHTVVLANGTVLGGTTFSPTDKPESSFDLPKDYTGTACATSKNKFVIIHDRILASH